MGRAKINAPLVGVLVVVVAGAVVMLASVYRNTKRGDDNTPNQDSTAQLALFNKAVEAVAASEDQAYERGLKLWRELANAAPDESAFKLNQAVTVLKWIDDVNNELASGKIEPEREVELKAALELATDEARQIIAFLESAEETSRAAQDPSNRAERAKIALLKASLLEAQAQRLRYPDDLPLLNEAVESLGASLREDPGQPLLAAKFEKLALPLIDSDEDPRMNLIAEAFYASWKEEPRNLYLLARANEALFRIKDKRVLELFEPSWELSKPMQSLVARQIKQLKPQATMENARVAIEADEWRKAGRVNMWYNVMSGMSGFNPDARRVNPDIMALLDTSFLTRLSQELPSGTQEATRPLFEPQTLEASAGAAAIAWFDYDIDLQFELLVAKGDRLELYEVDDAGRLSTESVAALDLEFTPQGMLVAEFFKVDDTKRAKIPATVSELMEQENASAGGNQDGADAGPPEAANDFNRHDTLQEVVLWGDGGLRFVVLQADESGQLQLELLSKETGIETLELAGLEVIDIESDGDLDLIGYADDSLTVLQNNGNRTFEDITQYSDFSELAGASIIDISVCDYDADIDQDVLILAEGRTCPILMENVLHGQFRGRELSSQDVWSEIQDGRDLVVSDVDGNSAWDVSIASESGTVVQLGRQLEPGSIVGLSEESGLPAGELIREGDFNNDGVVDLLIASEDSLQLAMGAASNGTGDAFSVHDVDLDLSENVDLSAIKTIDVVDANQDGALDIALANERDVVVLWGQRAPESGFLTVRVRGIDDGNGGGRNNHFAIGSTLELWSHGRQMRRVVRKPVTHFGLGKHDAENLRIVFSNGLTQNVETPKSDALVEEKQELKGSCPFVYGWNGERFELITDLLWNAPLGLQVARGEVLPDRRWEYLVLPGDLMQPKGDGYALRVTEELWEVAYFDQMQLIAVDHPAEMDLFSNEKVGPPSIAEHRLFTPREKRYPLRATDGKGRDQRSNLARVDGVYAQGFDRLICQGLAEPHYLELDFGTIPSDVDARLFLTGWMHPTDTSLNIGISQNEQRNAPEPPSLWVRDNSGDWVPALPFTGFPGGKPKSIVIDLDGVFVSEDHRLRLASSQQIYWDQAFVSWTHEPEVQQQVLECTQADLRYRGFGALLPRESDQPHRYDYHSVDRGQKWPTLLGPFTRFGDVRGLLEKDDDRLVVMNSGDEIHLQFAMPSEQTPPGWKRDFILMSKGWDKDADLNTIEGQGSLPLPFARQESYPAEVEQLEAAEAVYEQNRGTLTRKSHY